MAPEKIVGVSTTVVSITENAHICWKRLQATTGYWSQIHAVVAQPLKFLSLIQADTGQLGLLPCTVFQTHIVETNCL